MAKKKTTKKETTQIVKMEVTFINNTKTEQEIKELLGADDVKIIKNQHFELDK